jgi:uncharacterized flavoprotein (TIGR03862 family)
MNASGSKFIVAGNSGGLNITNTLPPDEFAARYGENRELFARFLGEFSPDDLVAWLASLGVPTRRGSGGKVFPDGVDAAGILSLWMDRLRACRDFSQYPRHRLVSIDSPRTLVFDTPTGLQSIIPDAVVLALGGASWPATGSDGFWREPLEALGIPVKPFKSANCGFETDFPESLRDRFPHVPLKNVRVTIVRGAEACERECLVRELSVRGELTLTPYGVEGGPIYALGAAIRTEIERKGLCQILIDLAPDLSREDIIRRLAGGPGKESLSNFFRKRLGFAPVAFALLRFSADLTSERSLRDPELASSLVKALPLVLVRPRPIEEAISTAGGVSFSALDEGLMLLRCPGVFCAGEMLDWEAPTGGFLLQGCFSTARHAALSAAAYALT